MVEQVVQEDLCKGVLGFQGCTPMVVLVGLGYLIIRGPRVKGFQATSKGISGSYWNCTGGNGRGTSLIEITYCVFAVRNPPQQYGLYRL